MSHRLRRIVMSVLTVFFALSAAAPAVEMKVSRVILERNAPIATVNLAGILPQTPEAFASNISGNVSDQLQAAADEVGMKWSSVLIFGTEKTALLLPHDMVGVADRLPIAHVQLDAPTEPRGNRISRIHLQSEGLSQLEGYISEGNIQKAFHALNHFFDLHASNSESVPIVESLAAPSESQILHRAGKLSGRGLPGKRPFIVSKVNPSDPKTRTRSMFYYQDGHALVLKPKTKKADFKDLYIVKTPLKTERFAAYGKIISLAPGHFIVMRVEPARVAALSRELLKTGHLGGLIKLNGATVRLQTDGALEPRIPLGQKAPGLDEWLSDIDAANIHRTVDELAAIFTRYHASETGKGVAALLAQHYKDAIPKDRDDVSIQLFPHSDTPQPSLIVRIKGRKFPDETVILGSHIDSINHDDVADRAPGADDNASGTATNLEIFREMMKRGIHPERTIEIHGYAAEEIGLVGSQEVAQKYAQDGKSVVAMIQFDMNLYKKGGKTPDKIWFVDNESDADLVGAAGALAKLYLPTVESGAGTLRGGGSDQQSWLSQGFRGALITENPRAYNGDIHTPDDTTESKGEKVISFDLSAKYARLGLAYIVHFGGLTADDTLTELPGGRAARVVF